MDTNQTAKDFDILALGEILLRLSSPLNERIVRGNTFEKCAGGAELNVVSGISLMGLRSGIISKVPKSDIGTYIKNHIRFLGVSDDCLVYDDSKDARLGIYFFENGAYPRKSSVTYDRRHSSINTISLDEIPESTFSSARLFHTSGITLALSPQCREVATECIRRFKAAGAQISFDVNFRANLWDEATAKACIEQILPYVDILFVSEETSRRTFGKSGSLADMMKSYTKDYAITIVASTDRKVITPKQHTFGSTIYNAKEDRFYQEAPYEHIDVVDRIGSGDAYVSGVLYGLLAYGDCQKALEYGNAASAIKNTIPGDLPCTDLAELNRIIAAHKNIGEQSEMNR
ncbi:MAG: sugar kinase [Lachnospiraceae bacterium]|nr:sugar kinase [Lachnospiraceae bacterium]